MVSFAHVRTQAHDIFIPRRELLAVGAVKTKKGARMQFCYELQSRPNWPSAVPIHCRLQYSDFIRPPYDALLRIRKGGRFSF